ncbi:DUF6934 family protein [Puia dinghuensis]|uniref:Uncharacterized protein n=1 Tax=Puia dinghuensis TaxID=1792502 RepID=A0A8J2UHQ4_9BACT|nr:hypothetical protein [Puia dinghuensis]GGB19616.1 hypothetical protein GCM10011511_49190 [Puia dinghuensis]
MKYEYYADLTIADDFSVFEFDSVGKRGSIKKRIDFVETDLPDVYNLSLVNVKMNGELDDKTIIDNGDRDKILATIFRAVYTYTLNYPGRWIYFSGNTHAKMRLYRMAISLNLEELSFWFEIYGEVANAEEVLPFHKGMVIEGFFIRRNIGKMDKF